MSSGAKNSLALWERAGVRAKEKRQQILSRVKVKAQRPNLAH